MAIAQAAYSFAVLVIVLWYTLMVWRMTDGYFRDEYKRHLKTSATEISGKKVIPKEDIVPKEWKEDPPWLVARRRELEKKMKAEIRATENSDQPSPIKALQNSFVSSLKQEEDVCYKDSHYQLNFEFETKKCN